MQEFSQKPSRPKYLNTHIEFDPGMVRMGVLASLHKWSIVPIRQCRAHTGQSTYSAERTQGRAHTVQSAHRAEHIQCRAHTGQSTYSAERTQGRAHTVQSTHRAEHIQCRAHTGQSTYSVKSTDCRSHKLTSSAPVLDWPGCGSANDDRLRSDIGDAP